MTRLHVNIDHIATLRQARGSQYPDPVFGVSIVEMAGAHGITVHLREDRRHICDRDVELIRRVVSTTLNLEMAATEEIVSIAERIGPDICTLVPEKREERTTEGGLDVAGDVDHLSAVVSRLHAKGIRVSLFINPDEGSVEAALQTGADTVELHTGEYCEARGDDQRAVELERLARAAGYAHQRGLQVAAGHGLHYHNVAPVARIPQIEELNIGHSIIARAVFTGLDQAVRDMLAAMATP